MTLQKYDADRLDQLALRLLDVATVVRTMAERAREEEIADFALHDRKPGQWLTSLEEWAYEADAKLQSLVLKQRGARRAAEANEKDRA